MIKIGILGSDNSHALEFAKLANIADGGKKLYDDVSVTHIMGDNAADTKRVAKLGEIPFIAQSREEILDKVDAAIIVHRDGKHHFEHAMPFIKKGMPVWIDKPITIDVEECKQLVNESKRQKSILQGGSNCKYAPALADIKKYNETSEMISATLNFPIYLGSIYSGMYFYVNHLVEMVVKLFGTAVLSVYSHINAPHMNAIFEYRNFDINLCFSLDSSKYSCYIIGKHDNKVFDINIDEIAKFGFMEFINAIKTNNSSYSPDYLLKITEIIDCLKRSADKGKKIVV